MVIVWIVNRAPRRARLPVYPFTRLPINLEHPRSSHPATDAHRHETVTATTAAQFVHELRDELRARSPQRMA
jgi:hypothetical protein